MRSPYIAFITTILISACGSDTSGGAPPEPLTCEQLSSATFCWAAVAAAVGQCMEAPAETGMVEGTFSPDGKRCTDATAAALSVSFSRPLPATGISDWYLSDPFTMHNGATECGTFALEVVGRLTRIKVTAAGKTAISEAVTGTVESRNDARVSLSCPDGRRYEAPTVEVASCLSRFPHTNGKTDFDRSAVVTLLSAGPRLGFDCHR